MVINENGNLNNLGQALSILDDLTNNNLHILYMAINLKFSSQKYNLYLFKILLILFVVRKQYLIHTNEIKNFSPLEIVLNRKYDKNGATLLLNSVEKNNKYLVNFLSEDIKNDSILKNYLILCNFNENCINQEKNKISKNNSKEHSRISNITGIDSRKENITINVNIYETNKFNENVLHYSVKTKNACFIDYFIKLDSDKNLLRTFKDNNEKTAQDCDTSKMFTKHFTHIWDAAKLNDLNLFEKILENKSYCIDEQTPTFRNTPLHIAASNLSDKIVLYLMRKNCKTDLKNYKNHTPYDYAIYTSNKKFIKKFKMILNKEITEFIDLENFNSNQLNKSNFINMTINNSFFGSTKVSSKKINDIKEKIIKGLEHKNITRIYRF